MRHFRDITKDELQEEIAAAMSPEDQDRATDYFEGATPVDEVTEPEPQVDKSAETAAPSQGAPAHVAPAAPLRRLIARRAPELNAGKPAPLALHSAAPTPLLGQSADVDATSERPLVEGIVPIQTVTPEVDPNVTQTLEALPHAMGATCTRALARAILPCTCSTTSRCASCLASTWPSWAPQAPARRPS